jgi:hypothetical protein
VSVGRLFLGDRNLHETRDGRVDTVRGGKCRDVDARYRRQDSTDGGGAVAVVRDGQTRGEAGGGKRERIAVGIGGAEAEAQRVVIVSRLRTWHADVRPLVAARVHDIELGDHAEAGVEEDVTVEHPSP